MIEAALPGAEVEVSDRANRKSFQHEMKTRIAVVKMPGMASGVIT